MILKLWLICFLVIFINASALEHQEQKGHIRKKGKDKNFIIYVYTDNSTASNVPTYQGSLIPMSQPLSSTATEKTVQNCTATINLDNTTSITPAGYPNSISSTNTTTGNKSSENKTITAIIETTTISGEKNPQISTNITEIAETHENRTTSPSTMKPVNNSTPIKECKCCCRNKKCSTFSLEELRTHLGGVTNQKQHEHEKSHQRHVRQHHQKLTRN